MKAEPHDRISFPVRTYYLAGRGVREEVAWLHVERFKDGTRVLSCTADRRVTVDADTAARIAAALSG